jgi:putative transposase
MTSHVRRHHRHYHSSGHVWQGRFKAFPIEEDEHVRVVLRYVERKPLRAGLVERAEDRRWSSLSPSPATPPAWLDPGPAPRGKGWVEDVNQIASNDDEIVRLQKSMECGMPFGSESWSRQAVAKLGLESSVRPRGRPRKILAAN